MMTMTTKLWEVSLFFVSRLEVVTNRQSQKATSKAEQKQRNTSTVSVDTTGTNLLKRIYYIIERRLYNRQ